ncbi:MAG TPA: biotin--[acetyl-CoA-carboxylase] ligase [Gemmatimonadales bacterium]|nr:biotin--[acetyl-CoA-carboxylase] ligase [Gemmatimonadales bacterium]
MHQVHRFDRLSSTQDEIHRLAASGAPAGTIVVAAEQAAGRGSRGRGWTSPRGGLWLTMLCRPASTDGVELLGLRAGLAVAGALAELGGIPPAWLKWPNDVIVDDRKLGGILCEARWQGAGLGWVAVGLGLNVRNSPPTDVRFPAASLAEWRSDLTPDEVLWPLVARLTPLAEAADALTAAEVAEFGSRDWLRGRAITAPVAGVAAGIGPDGGLRVRRPDGGVVVLRSGEATAAVQLVP